MIQTQHEFEQPEAGINGDVGAIIHYALETIDTSNVRWEKGVMNYGPYISPFSGTYAYIKFHQVIVGSFNTSIINPTDRYFL